MCLNLCLGLGLDRLITSIVVVIRIVVISIVVISIIVIAALIMIHR